MKSAIQLTMTKWPLIIRANKQAKKTKRLTVPNWLVVIRASTVEQCRVCSGDIGKDMWAGGRPRHHGEKVGDTSEIGRMGQHGETGLTHPRNLDIRMHAHAYRFLPLQLWSHKDTYRLPSCLSNQYPSP
jgi:hypothetical protein